MLLSGNSRSNCCSQDSESDAGTRSSATLSLLSLVRWPPHVCGFICRFWIMTDVLYIKWSATVKYSHLKVFATCHIPLLLDGNLLCHSVFSFLWWTPNSWLGTCVTVLLNFLSQPGLPSKMYLWAAMKVSWEFEKHLNYDLSGYWVVFLCTQYCLKSHLVLPQYRLAISLDKKKLVGKVW